MQNFTLKLKLLEGKKAVQTWSQDITKASLDHAKGSYMLYVLSEVKGKITSLN
jgi:hypothetical protein